MKTIEGVYGGPFEKKTELAALLAVLMDSALFGQPVRVTSKMKHFISTEDEITVTDEELAEWFKKVCLNSYRCLANAPNGKTKKEWRPTTVLTKLKPEQRFHLHKIIITEDPDDGVKLRLERIKEFLLD